MGLVIMPGDANHVAYFADVRVVVEGTRIIAATSSIKEGRTETNH
jgi:hypothetical protein